MLNILAANSNFHKIIHRWLFSMYSKAKITRDIFSLLEENNIIIVRVPANCTDRLQQMDLAVNKSVKDFMHGKFREWYCSKVEQQMAEGELMNAEIVPVDLKMSIMKPIGAGWLFGLFNYLKGNSSILQNGFKAAGVTDCLKPDIQPV